MPQGLLGLELRLARLDARAKQQAAPGQMGLFSSSPAAPAAGAAGGRPGKPCGDGHIAAPLTCRKGAEGSTRPQGPGIGDTFSADEAVALTVLADKGLRSDKARRLALIDRGVKPDTDFVGLISQAREKLGGPNWWQDESGWKDKLQRFAAAAAGVGTTTKAQPLPRQSSSPPAAARTKPQGKGPMTSDEVKTSADQLEFAKQQQVAARNAGDTKGEQAWAELQRDVQRRRLGAAMAGKRQSQKGLFGATDYDESLPLFGRKDAANDLRFSRAYLAGSSGWSPARVDGCLDAAARLDAPRHGQRKRGACAGPRAVHGAGLSANDPEKYIKGG